MPNNSFRGSGYIVHVCAVFASALIIYSLGALFNESSARRMLSEQKAEMDAFRSVDVARAEPGNAINWTDVQKLSEKESVFILDTRSRESFAAGHLLGAFNIPANELMVRGQAEIPIDQPVVIYCGYKAACEGRFAAIGGKTPCTSAANYVKFNINARRVYILRDTADSLLARGIPFSSFDQKLKIAHLNGY